MISVRLLLLASLLIVACSPQPVGRPATTRSESQPTPVTTSQDLDLEIGSLPLGTSVQSIPQDARRSESCFEGSYIDCEYQLDGSVHYLVFGHTLTRKRVLLDGSRREGLPFGLLGNETEDRALAVLNARYGPIFRRTVVEDRVTLITEKLENSLGYEYWASVGVGSDGRLEEVVVGGVAE